VIVLATSNLIYTTAQSPLFEMSTLIAEPVPFHSHGRTSTMESRRSIFGSLKQTLSRNKQATSKDTPQVSHPQAKSVSTPTRRPGIHRCSFHCGERSLTRHSVAPSSNPFHSASSFDAPPAYSPAPNAAPQPALVSSSDRNVVDDAYAFLDKFDTIFLIDDSGSMAGGRWRQTADALMTITPVCTAHDEDGVDIYFLNQAELPGHRNVKSAGAVQQIFNSVRPGGSTLTGTRLDGILRNYLKRYAKAPETTKPINIICITDGEPTDDVEGPIVQTAKKLDRLDAPAWQIGIQFFQVGNDPMATKHLKQLDDELAEISGDGDLRDMVDTVPFTNAEGARLSGDGILKVVLGAVTRRLDRKSKELHRSEVTIRI
jgi:uncharacterized protein YegL